MLGESVLAVAAGTAGNGLGPCGGADRGRRVRRRGVYLVAVLRSRRVFGDRAGTTPGVLPLCHFAVYAGIAAFGVGVQLAIETAAPEYALAAGASLAGDYGLGARAVLAGGVGLFLLGIAFVDRVNEGTTNDRVLLIRLAAVALWSPLPRLVSCSPSRSPQRSRSSCWP